MGHIILFYSIYLSITVVRRKLGSYVDIYNVELSGNTCIAYTKGRFCCCVVLLLLLLNGQIPMPHILQWFSLNRIHYFVYVSWSSVTQSL